MKKLITTLIVGLLFVTVAVFFGAGFIAKTAIEKVAPKITQTDVKVANVSLSPFSGQLEIKGLVLGNPEGFESDHLLKIDKIYVSVDVQSLLSDTIILHELRLEAPEIIYEGDLRNSNLKTVQKTVAGQAKDSTKSAPEATDREEHEEGEAKTFAIENIYINGTKVNYSSPLLASKEITFDISDIHLENIGTKDKGATAAEVVNKIMIPLFNNIYKAATGEVTNFNMDKLSDKAEDAVKSIKKGLGGLFGK